MGEEVKFPSGNFLVRVAAYSEVFHILLGPILIEILL